MSSWAYCDHICGFLWLQSVIDDGYGIIFGCHVHWNSQNGLKVVVEVGSCNQLYKIKNHANHQNSLKENRLGLNCKMKHRIIAYLHSNVKINYLIPVNPHIPICIENSNSHVRTSISSLYLFWSICTWTSSSESNQSLSMSQSWRRVHSKRKQKLVNVLIIMPHTNTRIF